VKRRFLYLLLVVLSIILLSGCQKEQGLSDEVLKKMKDRNSSSANQPDLKKSKLVSIEYLNNTSSDEVEELLNGKEIIVNGSLVDIGKNSGTGVENDYNITICSLKDSNLVATINLKPSFDITAIRVGDIVTVKGVYGGMAGTDLYDGIAVPLTEPKTASETTATPKSNPATNDNNQQIDPLKVSVLSSELSEADGDKHKLVIKVSVKNLINSAVHLSPSYFSIVTNSQTFSPSTDTFSSLEDAFPLIDIQPGTSSEGYVAFEVPKSERYQLLVENSSAYDEGKDFTDYEKLTFSVKNQTGNRNAASSGQTNGKIAKVLFPTDNLDDVLNHPDAKQVTEILIDNPVGVSLTGLSTLPNLLTLRIQDINQVSNIKEILNAKKLQTIYVGNDSSEGNVEYLLRKYGLSNSVDIIYSDGAKDLFQRN
jgi:hypothetical protein